MFARHVSALLKPDTLAEFTQILENEVLPVLRTHPGFRDVIVFALTDWCAGEGGTEVTNVSLWDSQQESDAFLTTADAKILERLERFFDTVPTVRMSTVINSSCHSRYERGSAETIAPLMLDPSIL